MLDLHASAPKRRPLPKINTAIRLARADVARLDAYIDSQRHPTTRTVVIEEAIRVFLERGDTVATGQGWKKNYPTKLNSALRLPSDLLTRLDGFVESLTPPTTRTLVIEEAIRALLDREGA
jgi:predicted transcriptional regulator